MHVTDMIRYWGKTDPQRPALVQPELVTSYKALDDAIESIGQRIDRFGLDRSGVVGVCLLSPSFYVATVLALLRRDYCAALLHTRYLPLLRAAGVRDLIYDTHGQVLPGGRNIRFDESWLPGRETGAPTQQRQAPAAPGGDLVYFTSGTTGLPKKVVQSSAALARLLEYPYTCASGPQRSVLVMPGLSSTFGFNRVFEILNAGKTACFAPDAISALALISLHQIEVVVVSATQALDLVKAKTALPGLRVDSIEAIFVGGGQIAPEAIAAIRGTLCRQVLNQYGSTEAGVIALTPYDALGDRAGAIALPWVALEIIDETGQVLSPGSEGIVRYRTPQLAANLAQGDSPANVRDGWFYPGDIGALTADGILRLRGRSSDVINRGGVKVSGTRIEQVVCALPGIKEAAACGIVGSSGLEEIWLAVVPDGSVDLDDVKQALRDHPDVGIAPDEVVTLDELPRGGLGKVQTYRLKELLLSRKQAA